MIRDGYVKKKLHGKGRHGKCKEVAAKVATQSKKKENHAKDGDYYHCGKATALSSWKRENMETQIYHVYIPGIVVFIYLLVKQVK